MNQWQGNNKFIPCFGSLPYGITDPDPELISAIDDVTLEPYTDTYKWLVEVDKNIEGLECVPQFKIVNDGL